MNQAVQGRKASCSRSAGDGRGSGADSKENWVQGPPWKLLFGAMFSPSLCYQGRFVQIPTPHLRSSSIFV